MAKPLLTPEEIATAETEKRILGNDGGSQSTLSGIHDLDRVGAGQRLMTVTLGREPKSRNTILNDPRWMGFIDMLTDALVEMKLRKIEIDQRKTNVNDNTNLNPDQLLRD